VVLPFKSIRARLSQAQLSDLANRERALPSASGFANIRAKAVPVEKILISERLGYFAGQAGDGRKVLLTMFARQFFPSCRAMERFR
jgi:hypothetical protein